MDIWKRIKSLLMSIGSVAITALVVVIVTPEGSAFLEYVRGLFTGAGIPAVVVTFGALFLAEIWRHLVNVWTIAAAARKGLTTASSVRARAETDLQLY